MAYLAFLVVFLALNSHEVPDLAPKVGNVRHTPLVKVFVVIKVEAVFTVYDSLEAVHLGALWVGMAPKLDWIRDGVSDHGRTGS